MTQASVSQALAASKFAPIAGYIRDEQYRLRNLGQLRARAIGWALFACIVAVAGLAGAIALYFRRSPGLPEDTLTGAVILLIPLAIAYFVVLGAFVRMRGVSGHYPELAAFDERKPILYLRNFAAENPDLQAETGALPISVKASFEHLIGTFFWKYGRVVALGDPLQRRPSGSVSRLFVTDAGWSDTVSCLMQQCQATIIHYDAGANVDWEVDQSQRFPETPRLVIMNAHAKAGEKRVSDLPAPAALRDAFAQSKRKLLASDFMLGVVRDRKGETILIGEPSAQTLGAFLTRFRRSFTTRPTRERLPPTVAELRDTLHFWTYLPAHIALIGPAAVLLVLAAAWLIPGLWA